MTSPVVWPRLPFVAANIAMMFLAACRWPWDDSSPENTPPNVVSQAFSGIEDTLLDGKVFALDPDDTLVYSVVDSPDHGTLEFSGPGGAFRYLPSPNFNGGDSFRVQVEDSRGQRDTAIMGISISPVNDGPEAVDDVFADAADAPLHVLANDSDPDGQIPVVSLASGPEVGSATVASDGTIHLVLPEGFKGVTRFRYRLDDAGGLTSEANAVAFVGVKPFKVVYRGNDGIFIHDLLTTRRVSPVDAAQPPIVSMRVSTNGRGLVYRVYEDGSDRLMYVNLANPDVAIPAEPSITWGCASGCAAPKSRPELRDYQINADGSFVVSEWGQFNKNGYHSSVGIFDAGTGSAALVRQSNTPIEIPAHPQFNATGNRLYFVSRVSPDGGIIESKCAIVRMTLPTRAVARVSPAYSCLLSMRIYSVSNDESRIVDVPRSTMGGDSSSAYLVDPAKPDATARINLNSRPYFIVTDPTLSPDGQYVLLGAMPVIEWTATPPAILWLVQSPAPGTPRLVGDETSQTDAEVQGLSAARMMRRDSRALLVAMGGVPGTQNLFEVMFDDPSNPVRVNGDLAANELITSARYSPDGERFFYIRQEFQGNHRQLELTPRAAIGTSIVLSLPADQINSFELDPEGHVALITYAGSPGAPFALVNAAVPMTYLPLAGPDARSGWPAVVVPR